MFHNVYTCLLWIARVMHKLGDAKEQIKGFCSMYRLMSMLSRRNAS